MARSEGNQQMKTDEILQLMAGMAANKIATLKLPDGLELHAAVNVPFVGNPASGIVLPKAAYPVTVQGAMEAVAASKAAVPPPSPKTAEDRLKEMQARTAAVRGRAASGIGTGTGKAIRQIFKEAKSPPSAPKPTTT
jgi:hypothetical protein